jgi:hypothetical protein
VVNFASLEAWLVSLGKLPIISVTIGGRTRPYRPLPGTGSAADLSDPTGGTWLWSMGFEPVPGT